MTKNKDIIYHLSVSLEELYNGSVKRIEFKKRNTCMTCEGKDTQEILEICSACWGIEVISTSVMSTTITIKLCCRNCQGKGEVSTILDCMTCKGEKYIKELKIVKVYVKKGMADGHRITLEGKNTEKPDLEPGNLIVEIDEKEHHLYKRRENDLILDLEIDMVEALCGFRKVIKTLDKRSLVINTIPGEVLKPGDVKRIMNEGMPKLMNPLEKGCLIIQFLVNFPNKLAPNKLALLETCLPPRPEETTPELSEKVTPSKVDPNYRSKGQKRQRKTDSDNNSRT